MNLESLLKDFKSADFICIKDKLYLLPNCKSSEEENSIIPYLELTLNFMNFLIDTNKNEIIFKDKEKKKFLLEDFIPDVAKFLLSNKTFFKNESENLCFQILINCVYIFILFLNEENVKLAEMFKMIVDPSKPFYKLNNLDDFQLKPVSIFSLFY